MNMIRMTIVLALATFIKQATAQEFLPTDYLSKEFHAGRREALRKIMPDHSVVVIFSYPERVFSRDINYNYHPNPDLYYFSGYKEPDAVLFIFKDPQHRGDTTYNELFFVRKRNPAREQVTGRRLGVEGVKNQLGFKQVYNGEEFADFPIDFSSISKIIYDIFPDVTSSGNLQSLVKTFRAKAGIQKFDSRELTETFNILLQFASPSNAQRMAFFLKNRMSESGNDDFKTNPILLELINKPDSATLVSALDKIKKNPSPANEYNTLTSALRETKTPEELALLKKSVFISAIAHTEVMKAIRPDMSESALTGIFEYVHKKYGAEDEGYPPIVGAGANGCILHYEENNATRVNNQLVVMDVASEYHGYSADITRTVPANGKFTPDQKAIYQLVFDAQEAVFTLCKEGTPFPELNKKATAVLADGLLKLGIITDKKDVGRYYLHSCSHHMGLDVHDKNVTAVLKENMVITVEPGIYIPKGSPCDPKWWNIGVRIEDDVLIGKNAGENLSAAAPRKVEDVEKMAAQKSVFKDQVLPSMN